MLDRIVPLAFFVAAFCLLLAKIAGAGAITIEPWLPEPAIVCDQRGCGTVGDMGAAPDPDHYGSGKATPETVVQSSPRIPRCFSRPSWARAAGVPVCNDLNPTRTYEATDRPKAPRTEIIIDGSPSDCDWCAPKPTWCLFCDKPRDACS